MSLDLNFRPLGQPAGQAPDLVIAHGLFGSASNWQSVARLLADQFRILLVDLRNHGDSPHSDDMSYTAMADDLARLITRHCSGAAHLVGHSMGGKAAMVTALRHPGVVRSLVAADIAPVARLSGFDDYTAAMQAIPLEQIQSRADAESWLVEVAPEAGVRGFLLQNLRRDQDGQWRWRINLEVLAQALPQIAGFPALETRWDGPVLLLRGADSGYVTDDDFAQAQQLFPNARLETVAHASHWLHAQQPDAVAAAIAGHIAAAQ